MIQIFRSKRTPDEELAANLRLAAYNFNSAMKAAEDAKLSVWIAIKPRFSERDYFTGITFEKIEIERKEKGTRL